MRLSGRRMNGLIRSGWDQIREEQPGVSITAGSVRNRGSAEVPCFGKGKFGKALWTQVAAVLVFGLIFMFTLAGFRQSECALSFTRNELNQIKVQLIPDDFKELKL